MQRKLIPMRSAAELQSKQAFASTAAHPLLVLGGLRRFAVHGIIQSILGYKQTSEQTLRLYFFLLSRYVYLKTIFILYTWHLRANNNNNIVDNSWRFLTVDGCDICQVLIIFLRAHKNYLFSFILCILDSESESKIRLFLWSDPISEI